MTEQRTGRLDPITFEILHHRLWAINTEAAETVKLVSVPCPPKTGPV